MTYGDTSGAFPHTSSRGAKYIYITYDHDANAILSHTLKSHHVHEIVQAWTTMYAQLTKRGHALSNFILNNECSNRLRKSMLKKDITFQLIPPDAHRRNAVELAIRTFKRICLQVLIGTRKHYIEDCPVTQRSWIYIDISTNVDCVSVQDLVVLYSA